MRAISKLTDEELVRLLKTDNEEAFAEIYRRYSEHLTNFATSKLYNMYDAEDIIHDLFVKLWEQRGELKITSSLKTYLYTIIRYRIVDKIRRNITREEYAVRLQSLTTVFESGVEQLISARELQQTIDKSLNELSPRVKAVYKLSREEDLSVAEIAEKLQLSEQTVRNQLTAALKHMRQSLLKLSILALLAWWVS